MNSDDVAQYLKENPGFFSDHASLLTEISVPHPHGGQAIPLSDRQVLALRDENRALRAKLAEMIEFGEENEAIGDKIHRLSIAMLAATDAASLMGAMHLNFREDFAVPHSTLRFWSTTGIGAASLPEAAPVSDAIKDYALGLVQPYCGPSGNVEAASWFGEAAPHVRSVAHIPLVRPAMAGHGEGASPGLCFGLIALGSEDVLRFYPDMGTMFLKRLGELVSAALLRFE